MNRPIGVTILAVLQLINSIFATLGGIYILFFRTAIFQRIPETENLPQSPTFIAGFAIILIIIGLIGFLLAYGLYTLKGWAWLIALTLNILSIFSSLSAIIFNPTKKGGDTFGLIIASVIVYYLLRPEVKRAFGKN
ncbi:hypothetical protein ACE1B6_24605 [Aerosakkonemataceae cyanobacterium BLCC-F154]|uniref:DUF2127 domain-containing protein n=1 Tax=Floridaenema fluviatile BLCC-F154 TaxID=3153640 RepID=A0ABV4YHY6_9CYAN